MALLLIVGAVVLARPLWTPRLPDGSLVEVDGEVPHPGTYLVDPPTVGEAVRAAGGTLPEPDDRVVPAGHRVVVRPGGVAIQGPTDPLLVGLPIDVNEAGADAIAAVPGISRNTAEAIVEDRATRGPFYAVSDLTRVKGLGPSTYETLAPFVTVGQPGERPRRQKLDLNAATAWQLDGLPGIGPVTSARIVVHREDHGPFQTVDDLQDVDGIGPKTVDGLRDLVEIR